MFGRIYAIALNTFREAIRMRFLYAVLVLIVAFNLFAAVVGEMTQNEDARTAIDFGLFAISITGSFLAIVLGVLLLYNEIQRRTIHTILSKPINRAEFVLGKYLGMIITLSLMIAAFAATTALVLYLRDVPIEPALLKAVLLSYMEVLLVAAMAIFFSSFSSPILSGVFTLGLWILGNRTDMLKAAAETAEQDWIRVLSQGALRALPDLHLYSVSGGTVDGEYVSVHSTFVGWDYVATALGYGALYLAILLLLSAVIFSRRDFA